MAGAAAAAETRGIRSMVGFNYRRVPAVALARNLVAEGRLGTIHHVRAQYLQDWIVDPSFPLVWRLQKDRAGSGALGDIGAHIIDVAQHVVGAAITGVTGLTETFIRQRPLHRRQPGGCSRSSAIRSLTVFSVIGWPVSSAVRYRSNATTSEASVVENSSGTPISVRRKPGTAGGFGLSGGHTS